MLLIESIEVREVCNSFESEAMLDVCNIQLINPTALHPIDSHGHLPSRNRINDQYALIISASHHWKSQDMHRSFAKRQTSHLG
jgi:hypothetical protein